jgi:site-specific recombinase XerD
MTTTLSTRLSPEIEQSISDFAETTTGREMKRAADIRRDKIYAVRQFFAPVKKSPDQITVSDVNIWHQWMLDEGNLKRGKQSADENKGEYADPDKRGLEESTIYVRLSHLSTYFEWLVKMPAFFAFIKINPARAALPKPPKKYNSSKGKSLTDEDFLKLWNHVAKLAEDKRNRVAARDYAVLTLFAATTPTIRQAGSIKLPNRVKSKTSAMISLIG